MTRSQILAREQRLSQRTLTADVRLSLPQLRTDLANLDTGHEITVLVPKLHEEAEHAVARPVNNELGKDNTMCGSIHASRPPFH